MARIRLPSVTARWAAKAFEHPSDEDFDMCLADLLDTYAAAREKELKAAVLAEVVKTMSKYRDYRECPVGCLYNGDDLLLLEKNIKALLLSSNICCKTCKGDGGHYTLGSGGSMAGADEWVSCPDCKKERRDEG